MTLVLAGERPEQKTMDTSDDPLSPLHERDALIAQKIKRKEESLARLHESQALNRSRLNRLRDPLARLPVELVSIIFKNLRPPPLNASYHLNFSEPDEISKAITKPLLLCAVCRAWRTIAFSVPNLWKTLFVNIYTQKDTEIIRQWLERSGRHSLSIYLFAPRTHRFCGVALDERRVERIIGMVLEYSQRCIYLNFDIPERFMKYSHFTVSHQMNLQMLTLRDSDKLNSRLEVEMKLETSSKLHSIRLYHINIDSFKMDWNIVVHAKCYASTTLEAAYGLVRRSPFLTHLVAEKLEDFDGFRAPVLRHECLTHLEVTISPPEYPTEVCLLSRLVVPALEHLGVCLDPGATLAPVYKILKCSACTLKAFQFEFSKWEEDIAALIPLLKTIPSIERLEFEYRDFDRDWSTTPLSFLLPPGEMFPGIDPNNEGLSLPNLEEVLVTVDFRPGTFYLDFDLQPATGSLRITPLYIYYLLTPEVLRALRPPALDSCFNDVDPLIARLLPFKDFFQKSLLKYEYDISPFKWD